MQTIHPDIIRTAVDVHKLTKADLAAEAGVHRNLLKDVGKDKWNPKWKLLVDLCQAVDVLMAKRSAQASGEAK